MDHQENVQRPQVPQKQVQAPVGRSTPKFNYCASGRLKSEVKEELMALRMKCTQVVSALHNQKVAVCRKDWDAKYRGEYPFDPLNAYISLVPGEKLDPALSQEHFDIVNQICELEAELGE